MKFRQALLTFFIIASAQSLYGYAFLGPKWTLNRTIHLHIGFDAVMMPTGTNRSFDYIAWDGVAQWGMYPLYHFLTAPLFSFDGFQLPDPVPNDDEIAFSFDDTVLGDSFGSNVLAVTIYEARGDIMTEADVIFNLAWHWDIPDGIPPPDEPAFEPVVEHEFGHVMGLDHPDEHGQTVEAVMNSYLTENAGVESDDYLGMRALYETGPPRLYPLDAPVLKNLSTRGLIGTGDNVLIAGVIIEGDGPATVILRAIGQSLSVQGVANPLFNPRLTVYDDNQQVVAQNDDWIDSPDAVTIASYQLDPENSLAAAVYITLEPAAYTIVVDGVADEDHPAVGVGLVELYDLDTTPGRALNISTRGQILTGDDVVIGGFIVGGSYEREVIIRAVGPSLATQGVTGALDDPVLELHDSDGTLLDSNDNWAAGPDAETIAANGLAPTDPKEAALLASVFPTQVRTAVVRSSSGSTGIGLVEIYDVTDLSAH